MSEAVKELVAAAELAALEMPKTLISRMRLIRAAAAVKAEEKPQTHEWSWECNECGADELSSAVSEDDLQDEKHSCTNCGGFEFHKVPSAAPIHQTGGK
jgi:hypothetical protein